MNIKTVAISATILIVLDAIFLLLISTYFNRQVQQVQGQPLQVDSIAQILSYVLLIFALNYFILQSSKMISQSTIIINAAILGACFYGLFELTNRAIFRNWSWTTVLMDTIWGATLFAGTTYITLRLSQP